MSKNIRTIEQWFILCQTILSKLLTTLKSKTFFCHLVIKEILCFISIVTNLSQNIRNVFLLIKTFYSLMSLEVRQIVNNVS